MKKQTIIFIIKMVILTIFLVFLVNWSVAQYRSFVAELPNFERAIVDDFLPGISEDYTYVVFEDEIMTLENEILVKEGDIYLPLDFVNQHLNDHFFWDDKEQVLTYTTKNEVIRMRTDELTYYVNNEPLDLQMPITFFESDLPYIPVETLLLFSDYDFTYNESLDLVMIDNPQNDQTYIKPKAEMVYLKTYPSADSRYIMKLYPTHELKVYGEESGYYYVRTTEGYFGYIPVVDSGDKVISLGQVEKQETATYMANKDFDGKVNIAWHQVYSSSSNGNVYDVLENVHDLDVISPTWFNLSDTEGNVSNIASKEYVDYVHSLGISVWGLFANGFDKELTHEVLISTEKREKVIREVLAYAALYELDGINIDFENVGTDTGPYFIQFIREITPYLQNQGLVVSVDMYVPRPWTEHYGRAEIGEVIDYLIIMAYDEHWSTSPESGSVASIGFVEDGVVQTMASVDNDKIILGVPFYTRMWFEQETSEGVSVSSKAYSMSYAYQLLVDHGAEITWDEVTGQYYGEYTIDGIRHRCWLEEERSIGVKVDLVDKYGLAGVAAWSLVFEKDEIWDVLEEKLKE